jgi:DNA-binding transcriptional regulator LsrR (DeoR family)
VAYAYGTPKAKAILAAMRAKMIDVLFTDSLTMDEILKLDK